MAENYATYDLVSNIVGKTSIDISDYTDMNDLSEIGVYRIYSNITTNLPSEMSTGNGILYVIGINKVTSESTVIAQIYIHYNSSSYIRVNWYGAWQSWKTLAS